VPGKATKAEVLKRVEAVLELRLGGLSQEGAETGVLRWTNEG
jgi:hypothetical protein